MSLISVQECFKYSAVGHRFIVQRKLGFSTEKLVQSFQIGRYSRPDMILYREPAVEFCDLVQFDPIFLLQEEPED